MFGRPVFKPGRVVYWLICMAVTGALTGCAPKLALGMSPEDLQTCDDTAATIKGQFNFPVSANEAKSFPWLVTPGEAGITSPAYADIFPYGEPVEILFTQAPPDPNVSDRVLKVFVTPIDTVNLTELPIAMFSILGKVPSSYQNIGVNWTPGSSGKFIILVLSWNLKNGGYPKGSPKIDFGPPSLAYVCVKIDPVKVVGANTLQVVTKMPLENITLPPTNTQTVTPWPTITNTFTFTPFIPTLTATFTPKPPTPVPPTPVPPTPVPPTPVPPTPVRPTAIPPTAVVDCSAYRTADECTINACTWVEERTGGGSCH
jgi:hypothetical protein